MQNQMKQHTFPPLPCMRKCNPNERSINSLKPLSHCEQYIVIRFRINNFVTFIVLLATDFKYITFTCAHCLPSMYFYIFWFKLHLWFMCSTYLPHKVSKISFCMFANFNLHVCSKIFTLYTLVNECT